MQSIKVTSTDKGEHHWEQFLMQKQEVRLNKTLTRLEIKPFQKRKIIALFKSKCNNDNIIRLYSHPIKIFLNALINNDLDSLTTGSSLTFTL